MSQNTETFSPPPSSSPAASSASSTATSSIAGVNPLDKWILENKLAATDVYAYELGHNVCVLTKQGASVIPEEQRLLRSEEMTRLHNVGAMTTEKVVDGKEISGKIARGAKRALREAVYACLHPLEDLMESGAFAVQQHFIRRGVAKIWLRIPQKTPGMEPQLCITDLIHATYDADQKMDATGVCGTATAHAILCLFRMWLRVCLPENMDFAWAQCVLLAQKIAEAESTKLAPKREVAGLLGAVGPNVFSRRSQQSPSSSNPFANFGENIQSVRDQMNGFMSHPIFSKIMNDAMGGIAEQIGIPKDAPLAKMNVIDIVKQLAETDDFVALTSDINQHVSDGGSSLADFVRAKAPAVQKIIGTTQKILEEKYGAAMPDAFGVSPSGPPCPATGGSSTEQAPSTADSAEIDPNEMKEACEEFLERFQTSDAMKTIISETAREGNVDENALAQHLQEVFSKVLPPVAAAGFGATDAATS